MASSDKVKVAVRVRPFNRRELELGTKCVVDMEEKQTVLYHPSTGIKESNEVATPHGGTKKAPKTFAFDHCFWSMDKEEKKFAGQENVFNCLGLDILQRAFEGYNACIFAYGQTGSGKSYSMMGTFEEKGIIPRLCDSLFDQIAGNMDSTVEYKVEVSYMEIYNERVRDLLDPKGKHNLKVREHNILGPYVDGLSTLAVSSFQNIDNLMSEGNKSRTVAATNMNSESSRSHAVFNIILTATMTDTQSGVSGEKVSKMSLVDLAGSERAQKTGAVGDRLKEGSNINKSLTTLGLVISALADSSSKSGKNKFVPYRDSVLTWLLKDNLGGNSKTVMVATVSPSADNYEETLSTLRYADRAKRIINHAVVNEDPNARIIRELREEVEMLRTMLGEAQSHKQDGVREKLAESEKLVSEMSKTWEQKLKETEKIHQERQQTLEKMGISVQTSGIKVEVGKYYLVNLNADPSLNELLVYYLKERTLVGRPGAPIEQDIQLNGLGVKPEHAVIEIEEGEVYVTPLPDTRTCVNGKTITEKTKCKHSDRLLLGNYHFFRINCPKTNSPGAETPQNIDIEFAQRELMQQEMGNDPIQTAISDLEKEHEKDKEEALQKQRQMYEWEMQKLKKALMSPGTPSAPYPPFFPDAFRTPTGQPAGSSTEKYNSWAEDKERMFKQSLQNLKAEVLKANTLVREANFLAQEMGKQTNFSVTLQIPAANLTPNRKRGSFVSEPAILVKYKGKGSQVWAMDKFENKIIDMRDMYEDRKERGTLMVEDGLYSEDTPIVVRNGIVDQGPVKGDPFVESQENHNLIGVANVFLEALFYETKLSYSVPIISQQGEIAGKLHVELARVAGNFPQDRQGDADSDGSMDGSRLSLGEGEDESGVATGSSIVAKVCIMSARGLPPALANFVFCQYSFWNHPEPVVVAPIVNPDIIPKSEGGGTSFKFDHKKEIPVSVTEEFVEHCTDGALSIEVWGHRSAGFGRGLSWEPENVQAKNRSIMDRWSELSRKLELWVEIHELNEQGEYVPVELSPKPEVLTGGVFQLRQGHSRRILVHVKPVQNSGTLPLIVEGIQHVSIGCVTARSRLQKGLDSYQEEDLSVLRGRWSDALEKRREYLDQQLQQIMAKDVKSDTDKERERSLIDQWVCLTEERNAVLVPAAGSDIPGAPADWEPPSGMEEHVPVIFLDLNAEDMSTPTAREGLQAAGVNSILPKEHNAKFFVLPFVQNSERNITALVSWDSSIHDSVHLNRITPNNERVYLVLKVVVRLSHPAAMELVLRKRVCINVYKRQSITDKLKKRISKAVWYSVGAADYLQDNLVGSAVTYEIVSNIPKASEDLEDRESLAQMAASQQETSAADGETYIEKYIRGVSAVESILMLDRLRQEVAMKELMTNRGKSLSMRKATSVPNINSVLSPGETRAGSTSDLSSEFNPERHGAGGLPKQFSLDALRQRSLADSRDKSFSLVHALGATGKSMSLMDMNRSPHHGPGSGSGKLVKPMGTLLEEQQSRPLLRNDHSDEDEYVIVGYQSEQTVVQSHPDSDEFTDFQSYQAEETDKEKKAQTTELPHSSTGDSLTDAAAPTKPSSASVTSSGYGSQAVSIQTLSSEDSASVRSLEDGNREGEKGAESDQKGDTLQNDRQVESGKVELSDGHVNDEKEELSDGHVNDEKAELSGLMNDRAELPDGQVNIEKAEFSDRQVQSTEKAELADVNVVVEEDNDSNSESEVKRMDLLADIKLTTPALLMDTKCPSNLGTPLHPLSPQEEHKQSDSLPPEDTSQLDDTTAEGTIHSTESKPETGDPADQDTVHSKHNVSCDIYSENVLDELERLDEGLNDTFASPAPNTGGHQVQNERSATEGAINGELNSSFTDKKTEKDSSNHEQRQVSTKEKQETTNNASAPVKLRNSKGRDAQKRSSWADTSDIQNSTIPEDSLVSSSPSSSEVKLRKGGSIDVSRPLVVKKGNKTVEGKTKGGVSPMKATYRPMSMPPEMLALDQEHNSHEEESDNEDTSSMYSFGSRADLNRLGETPVPSWIQVGEPVQVLFSSGGTKSGTVQFVGPTEFATGNWVGIELDTNAGKNDGSVNGVRYFKCKRNHGIFKRHDKLIMDKKRRGSKERNSSLRKSTGNLTTGTGGNGGSNPSPASAQSSTVPSFMKSTSSSAKKHRK